ncbi:hypothetical protein GCM10010116_20970 [Microbispora rosea subsp. aerata]|nr:hypothetical protein [Microbispora rosea]GGO10428.1 hypothetical protein GCM10010116_20970 [Microbispora rosea subsp. aerata]GIH53720.1 hypothetical protein Mro02_06340 [Microbispora rosea subsp. aerata]GLJ81713.1 hypothetical protein GCM10017588_04380 [Microbispora rosea subsp. aerata]
MAFFRPRVSREAEVRYHADLETRKNFDHVLEKVREAQRRLQEAKAADAPIPELREAALALDAALTEALRAAEAGQRATFGVKAYDSRIARRKAKATPEGALWTDEVNRLRTLREAHRLSGIPRVPRAYKGGDPARLAPRDTRKTLAAASR